MARILDGGDGNLTVEAKPRGMLGVKGVYVCLVYESEGKTTRHTPLLSPTDDGGCPSQGWFGCLPSNAFEHLPFLRKDVQLNGVAQYAQNLASFGFFFSHF